MILNRCLSSRRCVSFSSACTDNFCLIPPLVFASRRRRGRTENQADATLDSSTSFRWFVPAHARVPIGSHPLEQIVMDKLALFCHVDAKCIISGDVSNIWRTVGDARARRAPQHHEAASDSVPSARSRRAGVSRDQVGQRYLARPDAALVGKYTGLGTRRVRHQARCFTAPSHATANSICCGSRRATWRKRPSKKTPKSTKRPGRPSASLVRWFRQRHGGRDDRGQVRERGVMVPYLGICLGMQCMVIEYARHVLNLADAHSTEMEPETKNRGGIFMPKGRRTSPRHDASRQQTNNLPDARMHQLRALRQGSARRRAPPS